MTTERLGHLTGRTSSRPSGQESSGPVGPASRQAKAMGRLSTSSRSVHQRSGDLSPPRGGGRDLARKQLASVVILGFCQGSRQSAYILPVSWRKHTKRLADIVSACRR